MIDDRPRRLDLDRHPSLHVRHGKNEKRRYKKKRSRQNDDTEDKEKKVEKRTISTPKWKWCLKSVGAEMLLFDARPVPDETQREEDVVRVDAREAERRMMPEEREKWRRFLSVLWRDSWPSPFPEGPATATESALAARARLLARKDEVDAEEEEGISLGR